jgi:hypothetical protein
MPRENRGDSNRIFQAAIDATQQQHDHDAIKMSKDDILREVSYLKRMIRERVVFLQSTSMLYDHTQQRLTAT